MKVLITGAGGFLGLRLARALLNLDKLALEPDGAFAIDELVLLDQVAGEALDDARVRWMTGDVREPELIEAAIDERTRVIFHLAAVVSGQAESEFDLGMAVNLDASRSVLEACRRRASVPRVIFTSSVAVYGGPLPDVVQDSTALKPRSSYGVEKAMSELLLGEYSRRGFVDGRALRLPTVSVRPGRPNKAASSFASGIIREPLNGMDAVCPVPAETRLWLMSPRNAVASMIHGCRVASSAIGDDRAVNLGGVSITVSEMLEALRRVAGNAAVERVRFEPDALVQRIVGGWPARWDTSRAMSLGFPAEQPFDEIIRAHMDESGASEVH